MKAVQKLIALSAAMFNSVIPCNTRHRMDLCMSLCLCVHVHSQTPGHQAVFINEPRLSDFKQVLLREGIQAEFVGGVLVCNNMVAVRRVRLLHFLNILCD